MIETSHLCKSFCAKTRAVDDVSLSIAKGQVVGFLGPNGAGKTTLMRILTGYFLPTSGEARVAGFDVCSHPLDVKRRVGYLPETPPLYPELTVGEFIRLSARLKGLPARQITAAVERSLQVCQLDKVRHKPIAVLSKGYRQRTGIAQALVHEPQVLILDEPTNGLDPVQIQEIRRLILEMRGRTTILLSTHILSEIEHLAERVVIINAGKIVADQSLAELTADPETGRPRSLETVFLDLIRPIPVTP